MSAGIDLSIILLKMVGFCPTALCSAEAFLAAETSSPDVQYSCLEVIVYIVEAIFVLRFPSYLGYKKLQSSGRHVFDYKHYCSNA